MTGNRQAASSVQTLMRTIEDVDTELRALAAYRAACAEAGDPVRTTTAVDRLLDERKSAGQQSSTRYADDLRLHESRSVNAQVSPWAPVERSERGLE